MVNKGKTDGCVCGLPSNTHAQYPSFAGVIYFTLPFLQAAGSTFRRGRCLGGEAKDSAWGDDGSGTPMSGQSDRSRAGGAGGIVQGDFVSGRYKGGGRGGSWWTVEGYWSWCCRLTNSSGVRRPLSRVQCGRAKRKTLGPTGAPHPTPKLLALRAEGASPGDVNNICSKCSAHDA